MNGLLERISTHSGRCNGMRELIQITRDPRIAEYVLSKMGLTLWMVKMVLLDQFDSSPQGYIYDIDMNPLPLPKEREEESRRRWLRHPFSYKRGSGAKNVLDMSGVGSVSPSPHTGAEGYEKPAHRERGVEGTFQESLGCT